jgi:hypothetical protein
MIRTISIPSDNVQSFEKRVATLNKRAKKLGCEPVVLTTTGTELKEFGQNTRVKPYFVEFTTIEITGEDPKINGYELIAAIDHDDTMGTMIRVMPGKFLPLKYRKSHGKCDHCNTTRNRKKTIVLYNIAEEKYMEIGRMCVKDYLETDRIDRFTWLESFTKSVDDMCTAFEKEFGGGSGRYEAVHDLQVVLACAIKAIADYGYVSKTKVQEMYDRGFTGDQIPDSTCSRMWTMIYGVRGGYGVKSEPPYEPTEAEMTAAASAIEWAKGITDVSGDYNYTIQKIADVGLIKDKYMGFAVSIPTAYKRAMGFIAEKAAAKAAKEALPPSEWVGDFGSRVEFDLTYLGEYSFGSYYGTCTIYRFREGANNNVVWMSSVCESFEAGKVYHVKGTVKKHDVYRDEKQTTLSRVKVS